MVHLWLHLEKPERGQRYIDQCVKFFETREQEIANDEHGIHGDDMQMAILANKHDLAYEYFETTYQEHNINFVDVEHHPENEWAKHPRYQAVVEKIKARIAKTRAEILAGEASGDIPNPLEM